MGRSRWPASTSRAPRISRGKTVGITGVPSDTATLDTEVKDAGGDPSKVKVVTIGYNGVQDLENHKVAAFTGFWPADGVQVQTDGYPITAFKLDDWGGPGYPGLVAFSTKTEIAKDPGLLRAFVAATVQGYQDTLANPTRSLNDLLKLNPALKKKFTQASLKAYMPLFQGRRAELRRAAGPEGRGALDLVAEEQDDQEGDQPDALRDQSVPAEGLRWASSTQKASASPSRVAPGRTSRSSP